ncbi:P pilus assembly protein, chaperone PapD [Dolichospermum sp. UHCC 0259]|uniref:P pilus assembly protein, chaperone PapD n=1 Tax=Dolichospermum sp. UHCC 0259 TaxID=2590010 RepID=UPI001447AF47|nr:P pilus assembly protein, chaperone PapD [Dolichospermum sp. UHCC 0259]MTJ50143.1 P pilus assembly protein, chaperone PapD [Dolichospermum sp. UHCC 0259]
MTNSSNVLTRVRVYAAPFTYNRDNGFEILSTTPSDLTKYLQFSPRELTIKPGESRKVRLISRLAPNLPDGEYRAVIFNESLTEVKKTNGNNAALVARIGVTFYVRKGDLSPKLAVSGASFNETQKQIQLLVNNSGQATARPGINWTLKHGENVVKTGKLDPGSVVPQSDRYFLLKYPTKDEPVLNPGEYQLSGDLTWGDDKNISKLPFNVNITIPTITPSSDNRPTPPVNRR